MKSILRATVILSGSSLVSVLVGLVSAKGFSLLLGPTGIGAIGLLQALVGLAGLLAGMGVGAGLVRMVAEALEDGDHRRVAALRRAVWLLLWLLGGFAVLILCLFRSPISRLMLGGPEHTWSVVLMGPALVFNLASGLQTSTLNAYHRVGALARIGVLNSLLGTAVSLVFVWRWREHGITPAIIAGAAIGLGISTYYLGREPRQEFPAPSRAEVLRSAGALLRFGVPYTASMLVGTGVQFLLPALILHRLGAESVGYHRAAISVSGVYLGFLLTAMAYDYFPRISAAAGKPVELVRLVNQQHRLVMLLAVPAILGMLALAPYLIPLIYASSFSPAVEILEWQLIGDIVKFSSWTMGFVVLVRSGSVTLFLIELASGVNILAASWLGMQTLGLAGLGIAFLVTYAAHFLIVWLIVRREIGLAWTRANVTMLLAALFAAALIRLLPGLGFEHLRTPVALILALVAGSGSLWVIWREVRRATGGPSENRSHLPSPVAGLRRLLAPAGERVTDQPRAESRASDALPGRGELSEASSVSRVDVIVPCYRYGHYLRDCVESVLGQEGVAVRVLIIDDASPDETPLVGADLAARDPRVEYRRHAVNRGHIATYNEGLDWATGDYALLLSADDLLVPGALRRATQLLDAHPDVGFVYGGAITFDTGATLPPARGVAGLVRWRVHDGLEWLEAACRAGHVYIRSPEVVVRTSLQRALGAYRSEFPHQADTAMWLRFAAHGRVGELIDVDQAYYRIHPSNMHATRTDPLEELRERRAVFDSAFSELADRLPGHDRLRELAHRRLAREALGAASHALDRKDADPPIADLVDFALSTYAGARRTPEYLGLRYRMLVAPSLWPLLRFVRDRIVARALAVRERKLSPPG